MGSTCRSCGKPVIWVKTLKTGKPLIVDAEPTPTGNVRLIMENGKPALGEVIGKDQHWMQDEERYTSHWATCPDAKSWRRTT